MQGDVAIIMASSSGLGLGSAMALSREGANVVINGRNLERLESAVEKIEEIATGEVHYFQVDIKVWKVRPPCNKRRSTPMLAFWRNRRCGLV